MSPVVTWACKACLNIVGAKPLLIPRRANLVKRAENTKWADVFTQLFQSNRPCLSIQHTEMTPYLFGSKCLSNFLTESWTSTFCLWVYKKMLKSCDGWESKYQVLDSQPWVQICFHLSRVVRGSCPKPDPTHSTLIPSHPDFCDLRSWDKSSWISPSHTLPFPYNYWYHPPSASSFQDSSHLWHCDRWEAGERLCGNNQAGPQKH